MYICSYLSLTLFILKLTISNEGDAGVIGRAVVNTIIGGCSGGLSLLFIYRLFFKKKWSYVLALNGALAGMVAMAGGCNLYEQWAALLVGIMGGAACTAISMAMLK